MMPRYLARTFDGLHVVQARIPGLPTVRTFATLEEAVIYAARMNAR